jgi:hypothetical protein
LLEPSRQNLVRWNNDLTNPVWQSGQVSKFANDTISPDGTLNASKVSVVEVLNSHWFQQTFNIGENNVTISAYVKNIDANFIQVTNAGNAQAYANFNIQNGTIGTNGSAMSNQKIEKLPNDWYRISVSVDNTGFPITYMRFYIVSSDSAPFNEQFLPTSAVSLYFWGGQCEIGEFETSLITTTTAAVTRSAETVTGSGDASTFNSQSGALFGEFKTDPDGGNFLISISEDNNNSGAVFIGADASEKIYTYYNSANHVSNINSYDSFNKVCISWGSDGVKVYINGLSKTVLGSQALSTSNYNNIKFSRANTSLKFLGQIKDLRVYKTALTDQELQTLTTI